MSCLIIVVDISRKRHKENLKKRGGRYCVAGTPNQESCKNTSYTPGITMHLFPTEPKCRAQWIKFVQRHRVDFGEPINRYASLCSAHFEPSCFENSLATSMGFKVKNNLVTGSIPTRHTVDPKGPEVFSDQKKRQVSVLYPYAYFLHSRFHAHTNNFVRVSRLSHVKFEYCFGTNDTFKVSLFAELFLKLKAIEEYLSHFNFNPSQYVNGKQKCDASPKRTFVECIHIYFLAWLIL